MIGITGANGQLGRLVIDALLARGVAGAEIIALVRDPAKAADLAERGINLRQADYNQADTLPAALAGVDKLLLISGSEVGQRVSQHQAVIDAAEQAGVQLLAYTSILKADRNPMLLAQEHRQTEALLAASSVPTVILRNGWYSENYSANVSQVLAFNAVAGAAEDGLIYSAARQDYAEAAAVVLSSEGHAGQVYELAGDNGFSLQQLAAEIGNQSQQNIAFQRLSEAGFAALLQQAGLPEDFARALADAEARAAQGWLADSSNTLSRLIGRATTPLAASIKAALN